MLRKLRAIVIDDEEMVRTLYQRVLENRGYEVLVFEKAFICEQCQNSAAETCADLILSDCRMPEISGVDFAQNLHDLSCRIPNIALISGAWEQEKMEHAVKLGCRIFTKPLEMSEFNLWLDEVEKNIDLSKQLTDWLAGLQ